MPPRPSARPARDGEVPDAFIVNCWKPEVQGGPKPPPLPRRPLTACENCRAAKVRCNGQRNCQRCTARRLACTYLTDSPATGRRSPAEPASADGAPVASSPSASPTVATHAAGPGMAQPLPPMTDTGVPATTAASSDQESARGASMGSLTPLGWDGVPRTYGPEPLLDWGGALGPDLGMSLPPQAPGPSLPLCLDPAPYPVDATTHGPVHPLDNYNPSFGHISDSQKTHSVPASLLSFGFGQTFPPSRHGDTASCPCRSNLMVWVPRITSVMREKRLDEVFKVTGEVTKHCRDILDCKAYEVRCSDLLLIMSVLQETKPCFEYIAESDFLGPGGGDTQAKMGFGIYEVVSSNAALRAMLAMDLVQRAAAVVTSVSQKGQSMINQLSEPSNLAEANVSYLETNISHFQSTLNCVTRYIQEMG